MSKEKKTLGPSKYANSKKKKQVKKVKKDPKISKQNHDLKVKIKNLQKEIKRIEDANVSGEAKLQKEQKNLEAKLAKLIAISKDIHAA